MPQLSNRLSAIPSDFSAVLMAEFRLVQKSQIAPCRKYRTHVALPYDLVV
jgi:hypothetical protein